MAFLVNCTTDHPTNHNCGHFPRFPYIPSPPLCSLSYNSLLAKGGKHIMLGLNSGLIAGVCFMRTHTALLNFVCSCKRARKRHVVMSIFALPMNPSRLNDCMLLVAGMAVDGISCGRSRVKGSGIGGIQATQVSVRLVSLLVSFIKLNDRYDSDTQADTMMSLILCFYC